MLHHPEITANPMCAMCHTPQNYPQSLAIISGLLYWSYVRLVGKLSIESSWYGRCWCAGPAHSHPTPVANSAASLLMSVLRMFHINSKIWAEMWRECYGPFPVTVGLDKGDVVSWATSPPPNEIWFCTAPLLYDEMHLWCKACQGSTSKDSLRPYPYCTTASPLFNHLQYPNYLRSIASPLETRALASWAHLISEIQ